MEKAKKSFKGNPLLAVFVTIFIDMLGFGILIPVFPQLITPSSTDNILPAGWTLSQGLILLGWLTAAYPIAQFFSAPIMGQLADRFGRKPVLAISVLGTALGYALFAIGIITKNIPLLFASRILDGFTGGNFPVAQAVIADTSTPKNRARNFGFIGMAFGLGFILGPYIGGKLADPSVVSWFSAATPFWFAAIISFINVCIVLIFLPETLKLKVKERIDLARPFHNIATAFSRPGLRSVMPTSFLFSAGFTFFTTFFGVVLLTKYGFSQSNTGDYFAYIGIWIAIVQGGLVGLVAKKFKDYQVLRISIFFTAFCLLGYALIPDGQYKWLFLIPPFFALGNGLTMAFNGALISRITPKELQGEALGINASVMALAQAIPAVMIGYIATINANLPIIVGSAVIALGGIAFWVLFKPGRDDKFAAPSGAEVKKLMTDRVLITGANGGIGSALAKEFAVHGHNLILTARRKDSLEHIVAACRTLGNSVDVIIVDLAEPGGPQKVFDAVTKLGHPIKYLVNNAGFATYGDFADIDAEETDNLIAVNISAVTKLTKLFLPQITKQKGGILNVASTAAFLPGPLMASYYASKAYVLNFSLGIREELAGKVHVSVLCPGPTKTGFIKRANMERSKLMQGSLMDAKVVAKVAYKSFMHNKAIITPGAGNKIATVSTRLIPKPLIARFAKRLQSEN